MAVTVAVAVTPLSLSQSVSIIDLIGRNVTRRMANARENPPYGPVAKVPAHR